jgi:signal transduction histidine kinase
MPPDATATVGVRISPGAPAEEARIHRGPAGRLGFDPRAGRNGYQQGNPHQKARQTGTRHRAQNMDMTALERARGLVSLGLVGLGMAIVVATAVVALTTFPHQRPGDIVVVPADRTAAVQRDAVRVAEDPEAATAPSLADAPDVLNELETERAEGARFLAETGDPTQWAALAISLLWLSTGALIVSRQPRNTAGWIFVAIGLALGLELLSVALVVRVVKVDPGSVPLVDAWALVAEHALLVFGLIPLLFLLYPDGRPPTPGWRWAQRILFLGLAIAALATLIAPGPLNNLVDSGMVYMNPLGVSSLAGAAGGLIALGTLTALGASLSTVVAVRGRFRRSSGEERQQLRWLVFVATTAGALLLLVFAGGGLVEVFGLLEEQDRILGLDIFDIMFGLLFLVLVVGIPGAYLIAIFKHGLWGLDVFIRKTVQYGVLVAAFALLAMVVALGIPTLLFGLDAEVDVVQVLGLAVILALAFGWIRGPAARLASRIVYGKRATPYEVLSEFSERVGETYSTEDVVPRMARLLGEATGAEAARVWLRVGSEFRPEASSPADADARPALVAGPDSLPDFGGEAAFEVRHQGQLLGALTLAMPPDDLMNPTKERLVRDLAAQAGLVLRNVKLIEELRASRQRLVAAQDEERRRLERNLHDGAQQQLVALQVKQRLADAMIDRDRDTAHELMAQLQSDSAAALDDLRDLARGIYPPLLADQGLVAALQAQARRAAVPTTVLADGIGRYPREVESAVYFCTLEALNNAAKYASAKTITVRLLHDDGGLTFEIADDGRGFDPSVTRYGTGLQGMSDRLDAIGGALEVRSERGRGTSIKGWIPIVGGRPGHEDIG